MFIFMGYVLEKSGVANCRLRRCSRRCFPGCVSRLLYLVYICALVLASFNDKLGT
jgi:TRAP-type mannitol/chloroaromatic compound transport system permease large subunit